MKKDIIICVLVIMFIFICLFYQEITDNQKLIANQNRYIVQVLLCNPIDLTKPIGSDLIRDPNPRKVKK